MGPVRLEPASVQPMTLEDFILGSTEAMRVASLELFAVDALVRAPGGA